MKVKIFHPASKINLAWEALIFVLVCYLTLEIPLRIAFISKVNKHSALFWIDLLTDLIFFLDVLKRFRTGYFTDEFLSEVVMDQKRIKVSYIKSWFLIDLISSVPMDLFAINQDSSFFAMFRHTKLLKITRITRFSLFFKILERKLSLSISNILKQLLSLIGVILIVTHLATCVWFYTITNELVGSNLTEQENWFTTYLIQKELTESFIWTTPNLYITSFYWATSTLTSVGFGDVVAVTQTERLVASVIAFVGSFLTGYIISSTTSAFGRANKARTAFREQMDKIKAYLKYRSVPPRLAKRIDEYFTHYISRHALFDEQAILQTISMPLRVELTSFLFEDVVKVIPFFASINDSSFLAKVMMLLKPLSAVAGDIIYKEGDVGFELYFVVKGYLLSSSKRENFKPQKFRAGHHFGEEAIIQDENIKREVTVTATTYCDIFSLSKKDFKSVVKEFPEIKKSFKNLSKVSDEPLEISEYDVTKAKFIPEKIEIDGEIVKISKKEYQRIVLHLRSTTEFIIDFEKRLVKIAETLQAQKKR